MITYWDTSALVPLLVEEPASAGCRRLWDATSTPVSTRLLYVEAAAALHQGYRMDRMNSSQLRHVVRELDAYWTNFSVIELDDRLTRSAAEMAGEHGLRGYDAVHCAAGLVVAGDPLAVLASGDGKLLSAWRASGAAVFSAGQD
ncbi:type II toxin-antitoxin system VapC family toxin [Arthrobacter crystallopoietes]|uniref:type II toxin-antitoxin system VapC family toxin n=1 Tax=Crystallibacter crystallopoietes TaxID=37928 RepID=UPI003D1D9DF8